MVRVPSPQSRLRRVAVSGAVIRPPVETGTPGRVAVAAGISPETLRKIEGGRMPSPGFGTTSASLRRPSTCLLVDAADAGEDTSPPTSPWPEGSCLSVLVTLT